LNLVEHDPPWPLLVDIEGQSQTAALMNSKAYQKSIEANYPWIFHPETKRVLPWPGEPKIMALKRSYGFYELSLPKDADNRPYGERKPGNSNLDEVGSGSMGLGEQILEQSQDEFPPGANQNSSLSWLSESIAERRKRMPDGSYTAHLFSKGTEKIRKKIGEEAIEVLLARDPAQLVGEISDLIYHLFVFLEDSGLSWQQVAEELERRHRTI